MTFARSGRLSSTCWRGTQRRDERRLGLIQVKELARPVEVHRRVGEEELRRTALDDRAQQVGRGEVLAALRGEEHGGVALPPGLERLGDVRLERAVLGEPPRFVQDEELQREAASASPMEALARWRT